MSSVPSAAWRPPQSGPPWALAIMLAHLALLMAWWQQRPPHPAPAAAQAPRLVLVHIRAAVGTAAAAQAPRALADDPLPPRRESAVSAQARPLRHSAPAAEPQRTPTAPAPTPPTPSPTMPMQADVSPPEAKPPAGLAPGGTVLNLRLPPAAGRAAAQQDARPSALALSDPRSNTARQSPEERLALALGDAAALQEEPRGQGRRRIRKGGACVDVQESKVAQLNPFEPALRDIKIAEPCR